MTQTERLLRQAFPGPRNAALRRRIRVLLDVPPYTCLGLLRTIAFTAQGRAGLEAVQACWDRESRLQPLP